MAGAGKKTFTAGETLTASDVNTYLMEQSVMVFGGTAARASAIPTPSTGMTSYIGVTGTATIPQLETYTGSAWQTPYGATLVAKATATTASSLLISNCFTSSFENYRILIKFNGFQTTAGEFFIRYSASGTPVSTSNYYHAGLGVYSTTGSTFAKNNNGSNAFYFMPFSVDNDSRFHCSMDVYQPQLAQFTSTNYQAFSNNATAPFSINGAGFMNTSTAYDGIQLNTSAGTMSCTVYIYGYRNS